MSKKKRLQAEIDRLNAQKPSKEMLERHGFKEGPILAVDETYLWSKTKRKDTYLPKLVNNKWASTSDEHLRISKEALDVISLIYLDYQLDTD